MVEKKIKFNFIKKLIKDNAHLFPAELSIIKIYFPFNSMSIDFIDNKDENVTMLFLNRAMGDGENLYKKILNEIEINPKLENLEKEFVYIHNANFKSNLKPYINGSEMQKVSGDQKFFFLNLNSRNNQLRNTNCVYSTTTLTTDKPFSVVRWARYKPGG
jgi:hypothetical protein